MIHCHSRCKRLATRKREHAKELSIFGRGLDALDKPEAWLQRQHERHVVVWGKMWVAKCLFFHLFSGVQSTLFPKRAKGPNLNLICIHVHIYLPFNAFVALMHARAHMSVWGCALCTHIFLYGNRDPFCLLHNNCFCSQHSSGDTRNSIRAAVILAGAIYRWLY